MRRIPAPYPPDSLRSCKIDPVNFVAPTGEVLFLYSKKKYPKSAAPIQLMLRIPEFHNFANAPVGLAVQANQPRFAVHGKSSLPKLRNSVSYKRGVDVYPQRNAFHFSYLTEYIGLLIEKLFFGENNANGI